MLISIEEKPKQVSNWFFFGTYVAIYAAANFYISNFILTSDLYVESLSGQLEMDRIQEMLYQQSRFAWAAYSAIPLLITVKIFLPSLCIFIYAKLTETEITWKNCFQIAMWAEIAFLIPIIIRIFWFTFFPPETVNSFSTFAPFSAGMFFSKHTPRYILYVVQQINFFEAGYWMILAIGIKTTLKNSFGQSLGIVAKSYGLGLLLWMILVCFLIIQTS